MFYIQLCTCRGAHMFFPAHRRKPWRKYNMYHREMICSNYYLPHIGQDGYRHQSSVEVAAAQAAHNVTPNTLEYQYQEIH